MRHHDWQERIAVGSGDNGSDVAVLASRGSGTLSRTPTSPPAASADAGSEPDASDACEGLRAGRADPERDALIESHLGLVVVIAKRYSDRGVSLGDLISEGNTGLVRAAARFDAQRGIRFSSYAYPWIEHAIRAACMQHRDVITIPSAMKRLIYAYRRLKASCEPGHEMSTADLAHELGIPANAVPAVISAAAGSRTSSSRGDAYDALKLVPAPDGPGPTDSLEVQDVVSAVASAMTSLAPRERLMVAMHFGLEGHAPATRAAIASELDVLPECVDWTLNRALGRLRVLLGRQKVA